MDILGTLGSVLGTAAGGAIAGPLGATIGGSLGGSLGSSIGGNGSSGSTGGSTYQLTPAQYAQIAQQMAVANTPLTLAAQRYGNLAGIEAGGLGLLGNLYGSSSAQVLRDAAQRGQLGTQLLGNELNNLRQAAQNLAYQEGLTRLNVAALAPQFYAQAGQAALQGDNSLALGIGNTNLALKANAEQAKIDIAKQQNVDLGKAMNTRAQAEGQLALGSQRIAGNLANIEGQTYGNLALNKAKTQSDLSRIRGNIEGQKELRRYGAELAMSGQRAFA